MPTRDQEKFYNENYDSATASGPGAVDLLVIDPDGDFYLTELNMDLANDESWKVDVRDSGGGNASTVLQQSSTSYSDGDFEDPVAQAGSDQEIAIVGVDSLTGEVNVNVRYHTRKGA